MIEFFIRRILYTVKYCSYAEYASVKPVDGQRSTVQFRASKFRTQNFRLKEGVFNVIEIVQDLWARKRRCSKENRIWNISDYPVFLTFNALAPRGPISTSNVTLSCSLIGSDN